jgi:hypothetical protein
VRLIVSADNENVGRTGRLLAVVFVALAFASAAQAKPLLGITGDLPRFQTLTGQVSSVHQAFLGWNQGLSYGQPLGGLIQSLGPIPMLHLGTNYDGKKKEFITPAQIWAGKGDTYLFAINQAIAQYGKAIYVRPMAEMNLYLVSWSGYTKSGALKSGHTPSDYRKAFARIYLLIHGGSAATISAKLKALGEPPVNHDLAVNSFPRVRVVWSPLASDDPKVPGNAAQNYYPGAAYVDVDGGDIYDERLTDTAPWNGLEALYTASIKHGRPFAVPEWGLSVDDDVYIKHMCTFLASHARTEEAGFYESRPASIWDIDPKLKSKTMYRACVTPLGAQLPGWATQTGGSAGGDSVQPAITFTIGGQPAGSADVAPTGADELELDIDPNTGVIGSAFWIRLGKSLGKMPLPPGATGVAFETQSGASPPTPIVRPRAGTDFHVKWNSSGTITSAWWTRVGKVLAQIPVTAGETSIAMTQGP